MSDPFSTARSGFLTPEDIDGCLVLIMAHEVETIDGDNGDFDVYKCTVAVLDGSPSEAVEGDLPIVLEDFGISGAYMIPQIKKTLKSRKPTLGRVMSFKNKRKTTSYQLEEPTDDDIKLARANVEVANNMIAAVDPFALASPDDGPDASTASSASSARKGASARK